MSPSRSSALWLRRYVVVCLCLVASSTNAQMAPAPSTQPSPGGLSAGGLAPPPPMQPQPSSPYGTGTTSSTEYQLQTSVQEDSGRGLEWFWVNAEVGYQIAGLNTFKSSGLTYGGVQAADGGLVYGAGLGVRLLVFTIGARARMGNFSQWNMGTLDGEFGFRMPIGRLEPHASLAGGYAFLSSFDPKYWGSSELSVRGFNVRAALGFDYYVTPVFSVGANLSGEMLSLSRKGLDVASTLDAAARAAAKESGTSIGSSATMTAVFGLHF